MSTKRLTRRLFLAGGLVAVAAAPCYRLTHPQLPGGIPVREYQYKRFSQPQRAVSAVGILVREPAAVAAAAAATGNLPPSVLVMAAATTDNPVKAYQFVDRPRLIIDHCSVSQLSVLLYKSGGWTVSLRADQNPVQLEPPLLEQRVTTAEPVRKFTAHLQRNQFVVRIQCYGGNAPAPVGTLLGPPVMIPLEPRPFWVQKETPYWFVDRGSEVGIREYFDSIDHVELEFSYRTDQDG